MWGGRKIRGRLHFPKTVTTKQPPLTMWYWCHPIERCLFPLLESDEPVPVVEVALCDFQGEVIRGDIVSDLEDALSVNLTTMLWGCPGHIGRCFVGVPGYEFGWHSSQWPESVGHVSEETFEMTPVPNAIRLNGRKLWELSPWAEKNFRIVRITTNKMLLF